MGILDEAIREHLELKRQHGAEQSELQQIEDEAFGPPARPGDEEGEPGPSEAPTQFMPLETGEAAGPPGEAAPEAPFEAEAPPAADEAPAAEAPPAANEAPAAETAPPPQAPEPPAEEEHPAGELEMTRPPDSGGRPNTEEREAIAAQPTELHDVPAELAAEEEAVDSARAAGPEPEAEPEASESLYDFEDDDFFDEKSLSDELDQALEAPEARDGPAAETVTEPPVPTEPESEPAEPEPEPEPAEPAEPEPEPVEPADVIEPEPESSEADSPSESSDAFFDQESEDVLEETPEFLQDTPENERLWFEQKPPKDFDFDD